MMNRWPCAWRGVVGGASSLILLLGAGCDETATVKGSTGHTVQTISQDAFRFTAEEKRASDCYAEAQPQAGPATPVLEEARALIGDGQAEFIVLMDDEIESPHPEAKARSHDSTEFLVDDSTYVVRATEIADSQVCAVAAVDAVGGVYIQSFLVINAFTTLLTVDQAQVIVQRSDVKEVQLSRVTVSPP